MQCVNSNSHLFNVYAPWNGIDKQVLWDSLTTRIQGLLGKKVCVCGDFNAVRCREERRPVSTSGGVVDFGPFNHFIVENALVDLPLCGRNFTWFRGDGKSMSRIDRFLLSEDWCLVWPNCVQVAHLRGLSDHSPLLLSVDEENWGPRPSRFLNVGQTHGQSRNLWLREGDANSKFFHSTLSSRRRRNAINSVLVDGVRVEGVHPVREAVFNHFVQHFKAPEGVRPIISNLQFRTLSVGEGRSLIKPFSMDEVKEAIWDCDSFKSPGPDEVNFGFIKDFWLELKDDVMRFVSEFHRNGKLAKGINSTFIALIPKIEVGILDGILIENEVVDEARKFKKELMLFKVDFEKAYDSVDWGYLDSVMKERPPSRDPLSPFMFLIAAEGLNILMKAMVDNNLYTRYAVGTVNQVVVSHLQFADDTLLLGNKSWANVRALRAVLVIFESMSGGKVNFHKSLLVGLNISDSWLNEAATVLSCKVGKIPFMYLGLPIGGNPRKLQFWEPIVNRIKSRLSGWNNRFLSFGGRLILLKSVLTSLPVYAFSFFKAPSGWNTVCSKMEHGGLGVRKLKEFNVALLGKWCWRLLVDREGLWYHVLVARYGEVGGRLEVGGRSGSSWWREVGRIRDGDSDVGGGWFGDSVRRRVGDGAATLFWSHRWIGGSPLSVRFPRLFDLSENKTITVATLFSMGLEQGGEGWSWRRRLWAWEEALLEECMALLFDISLVPNVSDIWEWLSDTAVGYSVRGAYDLLSDGDVSHMDIPFELVWYNQVPLKVSVFAWRLIRDRLPTKANLAIRGVIPADDIFCVSGCGDGRSFIFIMFYICIFVATGA
ncbi:uncharacterized protein [Medicago truncatula]|uniref:uncharacterized protein n=1 Tax=Medicago truncatula TaxID=3880 RepID=UPI000D2F429D|nr:uncharacterized protein LOC112419446 [Medicago truncatula]